MVAFFGKKLLFYSLLVFIDSIHYFSAFNFKLENYAFALISQEPSVSSYQGVSVPGEVVRMYSLRARLLQGGASHFVLQEQNARGAIFAASLTSKLVDSALLDYR